MCVTHIKNVRLENHEKVTFSSAKDVESKNIYFSLMNMTEKGKLVWIKGYEIVLHNAGKSSSSPYRRFFFAFIQT